MAWGRDTPLDSHCYSHRSCCKSKNKDTGKRGVGVVDRVEGVAHREEVHKG